MSLIEHIDVLWLRGNRVEAAFEVEHTTAVYSGLLRMSDLITLHPNLMIRLYIVAPDSRRPKVMNDLVRPTFDALEPPLRSICGFIPYSRLFAEAEIVRRYGDQLKPGFLSGIAEYAPDLDMGSGRPEPASPLSRPSPALPILVPLGMYGDDGGVMTGVSHLGSIVRCRSAEIRLVAGVLLAVLVCLLLLAPPSFAGWPLMGGPIWYWQNPTPQGNTMSGVSFTSAAKGWAAGYGGRILVTKDGASTWAFQDSGVKDDLYDVSFVSDTRGWMVGDNGTVICTTNGGREWTRQDSGVEDALNAVCFVNAKSGWAVGDGVIVHTDDGGATWDEQYAYISDYSLRGVTFLNAKVGFLCGTEGKLRRTTDGGETWDYVDGVYTKEPLTSVFMLDAKRGWATIWSKTSYKRGILRTTDGGKNWKEIDFNLDCFYESVYFQDAKTGFIAGSDGKLLKTTDGGDKWQAYKTTFRENLLAIDFPTASSGRIVGLDGLVVRSEDGGKTWWESSAGWNAYLEHIDLMSDREAWVVGAWGSLLHTVDQGATWRQDLAFRKKHGDEFFLGLDFASRSVAVAVGTDGYVVRTKDGTRSWRELPTSTKQALHEVAFSSAKRGVIVGEAGVVLYSDDAGANWKTLEIDTDADLFGLAFRNKNSGCAVGDSGTALLTSDGGRSWKEMETPSWGALTSVAYASDDVLCAVGGSFSSAEIVRSTDAGKSWDSVDCPVETELDAVCFTSAKEGWAAGIDGVILQTRDAGKTWKLADTETSDQFLAGMAADSGKAWIVGSSGCILSNFDLRGGRSTRATVAPSFAPAMPVTSNGDRLEGAHSAARTSVSSRLDLPGQSTAIERSRRLVPTTADQGKAGHASTDIFLDFPDADHDDDYNEFIALGEQTEAEGTVYFWDIHGDSMDAPQCKVALTVKKETDKGWKVVTKASVYLSPMGTFHWTFKPTAKGNYCMRASIKKGKTWAAGKSDWEPLSVK